MKIQTLLVAMLLLFSTYLSGQATKSLPRTRTSNGTECYVYTVQPHDNVGEISKKFGVSQDEIIKENPEAAKVIKVGFPLYVPVPQNLTKQRAAKPAIVPSPTAKSTVVASKPAATKSTATKPAAAASESAPKPTAVVLESVPKPAVVAPAQPTVAVSESAPKPTIAMGSVQFVQHEVEIGQTLFSLCKQFNISQEELMRYNPILERGLKSGQTLNIPVQSSLTQASNEPTFHVSTANNTKPTVQKNEQMTPQKAMALLELEQQKQQLAQPTYTTHIVKAKETLYSVSRLYGMYVEDIINANPTIESSLKVGQSLKIPSKTLYVSSPKTNETPNQPLKIAFLLPFFVGGSDAGNERFIEFYSGALIAINEAKRQGVSFEIYTYDTDRTEERIAEVLNNLRLINVDFIIGPAYTNQIAPIADFAKTNQIYTLIPFSSKVQGIATNPYLIQFNPNENVAIDFAADQLTNGQFKDANIIFVKPKMIDLNDDGWTWSASLINKLMDNGKTVQNVEWSDAGSTAEIETALKTGVRNIFVFRTDKYTVAQPYFAAVAELSVTTYNATVYAQYNWLNLSLHKNSVVYVAPFSNAINTSKLEDYKDDFSSYFDWNSSNINPRYDLLGYDLTSCFIKQLQINGKNFANNKKMIEYPAGIQSQFRFERHATSSGMNNQQLYFVNIIGK